MVIKILLILVIVPLVNAQNTLHLSVEGLEPLENGFHYESWLMVGNQTISLGKFNLDNNELINLDGTVIVNSEFLVPYGFNKASTIMITIEPAGDSDGTPSETKYLAGQLVNNVAELSVSTALGDDFLSASGNYIFSTPTNTVANDELNGLWFIDLATGEYQAGLNLPALPAGWVYEAWAIIGAVPVSTGIFADANTKDATADFSGVLAGHSFPGEDFLQNAPEGFNFPLNLAGQMVAVSIEPQPDNSPAPFTLKPLIGSIPTNISDHTTYTLNNKAGSFPTARALLSMSIAFAQ